jgi:hypothetical protein
MEFLKNKELTGIEGNKPVRDVADDILKIVLSNLKKAV